MRILLITPAMEGGHHSYKASLIKAFSELGHEVIYFSQSMEKPRNNNRGIRPFIKRFRYISFIYLMYKNVIKQWRIRRVALEKWQRLFNQVNSFQKDSIRPDLLFFESLDATLGKYVTKWDIDSILTVPFSGILVCPEDTRQMTKSLLRKGPFNPYHILKSRWCMSIGIVAEGSDSFMTKLIHKPVIVLPDIVSVPQPLQDTSLGDLVRARAGVRFVIGNWGSHTQRKGISEFLQMCLRLPAEKFFFVMGGRINHEGLTENDKNLLEQSTSAIIENLIIVDQWLTDDELFSGILSCDLVFAVYPYWRFSSGIIGHAAVAKVPILVNEGFVMAKRVTDFNLGFIKQKQDDASTWVSNNITTIEKLRSSSLFKEGCSKYCERYGYVQWRNSLARLIEL